MITWETFIWFGGAAVVLWAAGALAALRRERTGSGLFLAGTLCFGLFIGLFWHSTGHPPMRTMGETRLWYSFCVAAIGWALHLRWHYRFLLPFAAVLASVFTIVNILKPEIHTQTLMPALQSAWFVPHVAVYMLAYALMAAGLLLTALSLGRRRAPLEKSDAPARSGSTLLEQGDALTRSGSALLILGMLMGSVWAKQAWGNYWAWDAKENWAAVTWLLYLAYIHFRVRFPVRVKAAFALLLAAFLALQITWYGVNRLPAAEKSLHTYTQNR